MKSYVVDFSGGVNQVADKAVRDTPFVSVLDNGHVRSGAIQPFMMPSLVSQVSGYPVQLFEFRGKFYTSTAIRSYTADYLASVDRVYYTEYGGSPRKIIEGIDVPLGTPAPTVAPSVASSLGLTPNNVRATEAPGLGNFAKDKTVSYRVAFETENGVQTPSAAVSFKTTAANAGATIEWSKPSAKIKPIKVIIFGGPEAGERRIAEVSPSVTAYTDSGAASASGEPASVYDQEYEFQYVYTFVRRVLGVENESAPSPLSFRLKSNASRLVVLDLANDGYWNSPNTISYTPSASEIPVSVSSANLDASRSVDGWSLDAADGRVKIFCTGSHGFVDGERVLFEGFTDPLWDDKAKFVRAIDGDGDFFYVDDVVVPTDGGTGGRTVRRVVEVGLDTVVWDQYVQALKFSLPAGQKHTFLSGDKLHFTGFDDSWWSEQEYEITVSSTDDTVFWVKGATAPTITDLTPATHKAFRCLTKIDLTDFGATNAAFQNMVDGDLVYIDAKMAADPTKTIKGYFKTKKVASIWPTQESGFLIEKYTGAGYDGAVDHTTCTMRFIPNNDYIISRRLYRLGDSSEYLLVDELGLYENEYTDSKNGERLGSALGSFYTENGIDVLYDVPPEGGEELISHYGMKWIIDDHTVRWTPIGVPDAWPQVFSIQFPYKPVTHVSFAQANCVLCEDAIYRIDGTTPTAMSVSKTLAEDGCVAPFSVQKTSIGLIYLSKRGLMAFDGQQARCITESRLIGKWLLGPAYSAAMNSFWWMPTSWSKLFQDLSKRDGLATDPNAPGNFDGTLPIVGVNRAIRSFVHQGKYFMYWSKGHADYAGHTMLCIDLQAEGFPITTLGFKPIDVCVSDMDEAYCLMDGAPPDFTLTVSVS